MRQSTRLIATLLFALLLLPALAFASGTGEDGGASDGDVIVLEYWDENNRNGRLDPDQPLSAFAAEEFGVAFEGPVISWNGGTDYLQQLRIRIAAGNLPDVFLPWGGIEDELIENDAVAPLGDLVSENMPVYQAAVPDQVWSYVTSQGDGEVYFLPAVAFTPLAGHIRGDWLDRLGLEVPTTIGEYVEVLRAFRDEDANGNGDPDDEFPTSGREFGRWMDHHFAAFGVAMIEGLPAWDIYDGEIQYSAVQPEMRAAIAFLRDLYAEGTLDPETFINTNQIWQGKITSDLVGAWYHGLHWSGGRFRPLYNSGVEEVRFEYLPVLEGTGFEGFYTKTDLRRPERMFNAKLSEEAISRAMRFFEWNNNPATANERRFDGIEGFHWQTVDGAKQLIASGDWEAESDGYRWPIGGNLHASAESVIENQQFHLEVAQSQDDELSIRAAESVIALIEAYEDDATRSIAGQFLPPSIYDGYPDIQAHKKYQEYAARIIVGEWDIARFDEFVEAWYEEGGEEVTARAQTAYADFQ
ncbi:MAG: extracellular solute-binding protein [Spirochaetota bacterium]